MPFGALAAAAVGVGGAIISSKMSSDSADKQQQYASEHTFANSGNYDPNQFQYGGGAGQAAAAADKYNLLGDNAQYRTAQAANYTAANGYADQGNTDASSQRDAAALMMARANGTTPSIAQQQAAIQSQQLVQQQASQAASARGAAGLALAGQQAATNTANGQASISQQAQVNAATERLNAEQAANSAYAGLRSGDLASQSQAAQQSQYNATLTAQQRAQNDQFQLAQQQNAIGVQNSQLQAGIAQQGMLSGNNAATTAANLAIQQQNQANQQNAVATGASAIGRAVQMGGSALASQSAPKADPSAASNTNNVNATASTNQAYALPREKGGPVTPGQPYLVGEKGPELIVPNRGGTVVPNQLSAALSHSYAAPAASVPLYEPPGQQLHQSPEGHAYLDSAAPAQPVPSIASPSGGAQEPAPALAVRKKVASPAQARKMTPEEMMAEADRQIAALHADSARRDAEGPAVRYAGSGTKENGFNTQLVQGAEKAYRGKFGDNSDRDYDLRGAFAAGLTDGAKTQRAPDGSAYFPNHLPDTYKKPNHETFSNESQYASAAPERAGSWNGDQYVPPAAAAQPLIAPQIQQRIQAAIAQDPQKATALHQAILGIIGPVTPPGAPPAMMASRGGR